MEIVGNNADTATKMTKQIEDWAIFLALSVRPNTTESYLYAMNRFYQAVPKPSAKKYKKRDISRYLSNLRLTGISPAYVKNQTAGIKNFFKWALGKKSPAKNIPYIRVPKKPQRTITLAEIQDILKHLSPYRDCAVRNKVLVLLLIDTGLRASEVCSITIDNIDLERRCLWVTIKGGSLGLAVFSPDTARAIREWLPIRNRIAKSNHLLVSKCGLTPGHKMTPTGLRSNWRNMCKRINKERVRKGEQPIALFSTHPFRRGMVVESTKLGAPTRLVQLAGRWVDLEMVDRYSQTLSAFDFDGYYPSSKLFQENA